MYRFWLGDFRRALALAEKSYAIADKGDHAYLGMMSGGMMDQMMWGWGLVGLLVLILVILGIAALVKFLFSNE